MAVTDRPKWPEAGAVLLTCAALLLALVALDDATLRRQDARAATAAPAAQRAPATELRELPPVIRNRAAVTVDARDVPGRAMALSWLVLVAAGGLGMAAAGVRMLRRRWA